jgi:hypothetical protein
VWDEVILLENQPDRLGAEAHQIGATELGDVGRGDAHGAGGRLIEAAQDIQQRGFAGTGRAMMAIHSPAFAVKLTSSSAFNGSPPLTR